MRVFAPLLGIKCRQVSRNGEFSRTRECGIPPAESQAGNVLG
jgi:hypothetical protein